jgi:P27 family predicted phage terminase small subunit
MGKRGPAPTPTKLRLLHGETRPYRINQDEPQPPAGPPVCPDDVTAEVRQVWDYTLANLVYMGIATAADRDALRCYCEAVVTHRKACAILARSPVIIPGAIKGTVVQNPVVRVQRDAAAAIRGFAQEFGFTPSARSEINKGGASHGGTASARYLNA